MDLNELYRKFGLKREPSSIKDEVERERIKQEIFARINETKLNFDQQRGNEGSGIKRILPLLKIAASIVLLLAVGTLTYKAVVKRNSEIDYITFSAPKGEIIQVLLPDSSKVWLNAATTIKYPRHFNKTRDIYLLEGEAYFDVTHNPAKPFIVHASNVSTRVLGTAFSVKAYRALPTVTVTVARGKVRVNEKEKQLGVLTPDQQLVFEKGNHSVRNETVNSSFATAWKQGDFILTGAYFGEIMLAIANRYNVEVIYDHKVFSNCQNSIHFTKNESLAEVLSVLKEIQEINYTIKNNQIIITGKPCK